MCSCSLHPLTWSLPPLSPALQAPWRALLLPAMRTRNPLLCRKSGRHQSTFAGQQKCHGLETPTHDLPVLVKGVEGLQVTTPT